MFITKRLTAVLLCFFTLLCSIAAIAGCQTPDGPNVPDSRITQNTSDGTKQSTETADPYGDGVPADLYFDGTNIRIITNSQGQRSIALMDDDDQTDTVNLSLIHI